MVAYKVLIALAGVMFTFVAPQSREKIPTARDYFNELYKAGALEQPATYACFSDEENGNFFTFFHFGWNPLSSENKFTAENDRATYNLLTKEQQAAWDRGLLHVVTYWRGVPKVTDYVKDGDSWKWQTKISNGEGNPPTVSTLTMSINWKTMRYVIAPLQLCISDSCTVAGHVVEFGQAVSAAQAAIIFGGQPLTVTQGSLFASVTVPLSGDSLTTSEGSVAGRSDASVSLTGQSLATTANSPLGEADVPISGQSLTTAAGTLTNSANGNADLTSGGQALTVTRGFLTVGQR